MMELGKDGTEWLNQRELGGGIAISHVSLELRKTPALPV